MLVAQNVTIRGKAHVSYAGKKIELLSYQDLITKITIKEGVDTIESDGFFELKFQADFTQAIILKIENIVAKLYVEPNFVYGITIPEADKSLERDKDTELEISPNIIGNDSTELNHLMYDFQEQKNKLFITENNMFLNRPEIFKRTDSLKLNCNKRYIKIKNAYFLNHVEYEFASINMSVARGKNALINYFIIEKPIQYSNYDYMAFFESSFKGYLTEIASTRKGQSLFNIINTKASWEKLNAFMLEDKFLKKDSIRELVAILNLWQMHYSNDYSPEAIKIICNDFLRETKNKTHKTILSNMLAHFNKMIVGTPAPDIIARTKLGTMGSLNSFKNRWIYLNFFSTSNIESVKEMGKVYDLKKKYADKIVFISICLSDSIKEYMNFLKTNPKFDWNIWYNYDSSIPITAKDKYNIVGTEAYFLISNLGNLAASPALSPSAGIEKRFNAIFKIRKRQNKIGIK